jgi:hypothetical protein
MDSAVYNTALYVVKQALAQYAASQTSGGTGTGTGVIMTNPFLTANQMSVVVRWQSGVFDPTVFVGRDWSGPFYQNDYATPKSSWHYPPIAIGVNTAEIGAPWNNAVQMKNTVDGTTKNNLYLALPPFSKAWALFFFAYWPATTELGANDQVYVGFEVNSCGGKGALFTVFGNNGNYTLWANYETKAGPVNQTVNINSTFSTKAWTPFLLIYKPPYLTLLQYVSNAWNLIAEINMPQIGEPLVNIICANESQTNIISDFYVGELFGIALDDTAKTVELGSIFNTSESANTNFFSSALAPAEYPATFRIYVALSASAKLNVMRTNSSNTTTETLNGGNALAAGCAYMWDIIVDKGDSINLQATAAVTVYKVAVLEVHA